MEKYLHKILETDNPETMELKCDHNDALINNTQLQIIHKGLKAEVDKEKLKKLKKEYDPTSEYVFDSIWDIKDDLDMDTSENNDNIVKTLYKELADLKIEEEDSSIKTVTEGVEKKKEDPFAAAKCSLILGGQVSISSHPSGMAKNMILGLMNMLKDLQH